MTPKINPNAPYPEFAKRLYVLRKQKKLSREQLADACNISSRTLANYESGMRKPNTEMATSLATVLEVSKEELLGTASPRETRAELKKADTTDLFREMYGGSTARRMEAIIEATAGLNAEGVLTKDEVEDFHDEMVKVLIRMRENARERFTPLSKRTETQRQSIAKGRATADAIDARIREERSRDERTQHFSSFLLDDEDGNEDGDE